jgi:hypothetical protein
MAPQLELQEILESLGAAKVYFQPPANVAMEYPCIVYKRDNARTEFAGNLPYIRVQRYQVTIIARDPNSDIHLKVAKLPRCVYNRFFAANSLNHDVYILYF